MPNDSKYVHLYPERAVLPIRRLCDALLVSATASGGDGRTTVQAGALRRALDDLDQLGFPPDEPLFLLRGQDVLAAAAVLYYGELLDVSALPGRQHVQEHARRMAAWQPRKLPD